MKKKEQSRFFGEIQLQEGESTSSVQVLKTGTFRWFGDPLNIDTEMLNTLKKNFDDKVKKVDLMIDYFHNSHQDAAGWITAVEIKNAGTELWLNVQWTDRAKEKITAKEIKYMSIDFDLNYIPNDSEIEFGPTLNGAAVTNRPFIKGMNPLFSENLKAVFDELDISNEKREAIGRILDTEHEQKGKKTMELTDLKKECAVLSEDGKTEIRKIIGPEASVIAMAEQNAVLKTEAAEKDAKIAKLSEAVKGHDDKISNIEKEAEFKALLSDGKAVEAQREFFMDGKMTEFIKLAQSVNMDESGHGNDTSGGDKGKDPKTSEEAQDALIKLAEAKVSKDNDINMDKAQQLVMADPANKALVELSDKLEKAA